MELITALAEIGPPAAAAIPLITPYLSSHDPVLRVVATYALARFGKAAQIQRSPLWKKISPNSTGDENAITLWALSKIDPSSPKSKSRCSRR